MLKFTCPYSGETMDAIIYANHYAVNGRIYLGLYTFSHDDEVEDDDCGWWEPYCDITVNLSAPLIDNKTCAFIDTNNGSFLYNWIIKNDLGKPTGRTANSGFCVYPEFELNIEEIRHYLSEDSEEL